MIGYEYYLTTGRQKSVFTPDAVGSVNYSDKVTFTYDSMGRLYEAKAEKRNGVTVNETTQYAYTNVGSLYTVLYPNGITSTYNYDALNRLNNMTNTKNGSTLSSYAYMLANDGTRTGVTEADGSTYSWQYDNLNCLTREIYDGPGTANYYTHEYTYDLVGNRLTKKVNGALAVTYIYDSSGNDRLLCEDNVTGDDVYYEYSAGGNLKKKTAGASVTNYGYDLHGRLISVSGAASSTYSYNPDGIRVSAGNTTYLVDAYNHTGYAQVFKEATSGVNTVYTIGSDVISQGVGTNSPTYLIYDGHGSVRQQADNSGTITNTFNYDAYGNAIGFTPTNGLYYTGEMYNTASQTYNLRNRDYKPDIGRLDQMDHYAGNINDPVSLHKYVYCHDNPINGVDPTGKLFSSPYHGKIVHDKIGDDFLSKGIAPLYNRRIDKILDTSLTWWGWNRPDLVERATGEVYEIKPLGLYLEGAVQLTWYLYLLNGNDPSGRVWIPGFSYIPPSVVTIDAYSIALVKPPVAGVIEYEVIDARLAVAFVAAYAIDTLMADIAIRIELNSLAPVY